ncbi:hypothetical protein ACE38W_00445 [Chitinophaga sp. Hz27]|uniref:hypothetical protein n=1 Tax=Chitinophaga sp. Hz27 TaxID=3347169 RepID=UPI0035D60D4D
MPDEVIKHAETPHDIDHRKILQSIIVAEERLVRPCLGDAFYYALLDAKNVQVTLANRDSLQGQIEAAGYTEITLQIGNILNSSDFLPTSFLTLWQQHLWKLTAECVMLSAIPGNFVQFTSAAVVHGVPASGPMTTAGVVSPSLSAVKWSMDKQMMDRIDPLMEAMHAWLCHHKSEYPLYKKDCGCDAKGIAYKRKSDIILGLYDDTDNQKSYCCYED